MKKDLTKNQRNSINLMSISDERKKLARKIVRFINNYNQSIIDERREEGDDRIGDRYVVEVKYTIISISDPTSNFNIDVWLDSPSLCVELEVDKGSYSANEWFIHYEIFKVVFGE